MSDYTSKLDAIEGRYREVSLLIVDPEVIADNKRYAVLMKEYKDLGKIVEVYNDYKLVLSNLRTAKEMIDEESDPEMKEMAKEELLETQAKKDELDEKIKWMLPFALPPLFLVFDDVDKTDIVTIRGIRSAWLA